MKFGVNPFMMGLLGGLGGFVQGYGHDLDQQRMAAAQMALENYKQQNRMSFEKLKAQNDLLIKSLQAEANQRTYSVNKVGPDGKVMTYQMRNVLDPETHSFTPTQVGDPVPWHDPLAATNATNATRLKIANMEIGAANARAANTFSKNAALQTQLNAREQLRESGLNKRTATSLANQQMKDYDRADDKTPFLAPYGIDPSDPKARAKYRQAVLNDNLQTLGAGSDQSQGAQPEIRYDSQGNAYIKGPDGKPVPYNPGASAPDGSQDAGVADSSAPDMSNLAMDQTYNSPDFENAGEDSTDDGSSDVAANGPGLLGDDSQQDDGNDAENDSDQDDQQGLMSGQYA